MPPPDSPQEAESRTSPPRWADAACKNSWLPLTGWFHGGVLGRDSAASFLLGCLSVPGLIEILSVAGWGRYIVPACPREVDWDGCKSCAQEAETRSRVILLPSFEMEMGEACVPP